jgi:hypothetical protein
MSTTTSESTKETRSSQAVPTWIASGILGLALGAGAMYLGLKSNDGLEKSKPATSGAAPTPAGASGGPMMGGGGMGGMGGGGMGMGGGMGGGGGGAGKRNLTSLVGKLELLSRSDVKLQVELNAEQAQKVAAQLQELDKAEKMTAEEAQTHLDALEALLTEEQKKTLGLISLPFGRPGAGGGGRGAAGRPGAGSTPPPMAGAPPGGAVPPAMMGGGMGGMGGGAADDNPFSQEANQKRLHDLLARLAPSSTPTESSPKAEPEKPDTPKEAAK